MSAGADEIHGDRRCPLCASDEIRDWLAHPDWGPHRLVRCAGCGLVRTEPQPPALESLYPAPERERRTFTRLVAALRRSFARAFAARVARRVPPGSRVLDVGCGDGAVITALAQRGFSCTGTELPHRRPVAATANTPVLGGELGELDLASASFDVVILRHVLEHTRDPGATLREARRLLAASGTLVVAVPNIASWQSRWSGAAWFHLDVPRHLFHFTPPTLATLVRNAGFTVERVRELSFEHGPFGWLQSAFNRAGGRWRALYAQLRPSGGDAPRYDLVIVATAVALLPACVILAVLEALAGRGAVIELWARPGAPSSPAAMASAAPSA